MSDLARDEGSAAAGAPARDVNEGRLTVALAGQRQRAVRSEELFRLLVENVRDYAIFVLDTAGCVATWNVGAQRIKGYAAHEIIGRHFSAFYPDEDIRAGKCEMELEAAARDGRFEDEGWRVRKDGSQFWANVVITALRDERDELLGFSKVTRDLTERKRAEDDRAARLAADHANRVKDEFLAVLGHELRNPLAPIATALQLMKLRADGQVTKEQQVIERQLGYMMRLVDDLLDVSRIVQGKIELKRQRLEIREILAKAIEVASPLIDQRQHHLELAIPTGSLPVLGDEARLTQVFSNLLVNAAKYTDPEGRIAVAVREVDDELTIDVRDNGVGIEPALVGRVFDLYVQGKQGAERSRGGLGIGLTLVRRLVDLHGGKVEARSEGRGHGSTFTVRLPRAEPRPIDLAAAAAPSPSTVKRARRVLVVDDNEDAAILLGDALAAAGYDVRIALAGAEALQIAGTFRPEVAILDIGLPMMDGYELASRLRADQGAKIQLIALTGYDQPSARTRSDEAGFDVHFVKPVDIQRLIGAIARA